MKERHSNLELLRIISMLFILSHHLSVHGDFKDIWITILLNNKIWLRFIQLEGKVGVNIFVMISGYFLVSSNRIKLSKVLKF